MTNNDKQRHPSSDNKEMIESSSLKQIVKRKTLHLFKKTRKLVY
jgi:hypothetical protein